MNKAVRWVSLGLFAFALVSEAGATFPARSETGFLRLPFDTLISSLDPTYQIGDEWGKRAVTAASLAGETAAFRRAALATASTGGGTSFYLGKFNGRHVMATNHHVFSSAWQCLNRTLRFPMLGLTARCDSFLGHWPDIDLALFTVTLNQAEGEQLLAGVARNFSFRSELAPSQTLITIGFGVAGNNGGALMANKDSDCKVFSGQGEYRHMGDPDTLNPGTYRAWSFANGCDVSHGDSGSAMIDRESGDVVGIIWTGRVPKAEHIRSSAYLDRLLNQGGEEIWTELSYAVPAAKISEHLTTVMNAPELAPETRETLRQLLAQ